MTSLCVHLMRLCAAGALGAGLLAAGATSDAVTSATTNATSHDAASTDDHTIDAVVLGDSYSAGNGAIDDQGDEQYYGPDDCYRSSVDWGEKYAASLRRRGYLITVTNHACSGGVTADFTQPRVMDTSDGQTANPTGATTAAAADAYLAQADPCNTHRFPDEEFWTYQTIGMPTPAAIAYRCTRNLRPQADLVTPQTDLVLFTMGGNDAGFSTIVQNCFVVKSASGCQAAVQAARALLPTIQQRLIAAIGALRAHGLRDDARIVQLGYPWLQVDNDYTVGSYDAGDQVRALVSEGDAAIAAIVPTVNAGHPGQLSFLAGVPEQFAGHEPDASTPTGNPDRWINQAFDGTTTAFWYHPNRLGQSAYADLLATHGTFGAPTGPGSGPARPTATARLRAHATRLSGDRVRLRLRVRLSTGARPHGRVVVRGIPGHHRLAGARLRGRDHGVLHLTLHVRDHRVRMVRVVYRDRRAHAARTTVRIRHRGR